jgi:enoyl-CoA hydratase/carnithine racemase
MGEGTTMPELHRQDEVYLLDLGDDENRFSYAWMKSVNGLLDEISQEPAPRALVTVARGKFYSNGLDLDWVLTHRDEVGAYVADVHALLARMLTLPMPTVAAVTGHAFGAGAIIGMAHDWRVMRADRGYYCFPEVDIGLSFTPGMAALIQAKLTPAAAVASMTTGRRFSGPEALTARLVDLAVPEAEVLPKAIELVRPLAGKNPGTLGAIKATMYASAMAALQQASEIRLP